MALISPSPAKLVKAAARRVIPVVVVFEEGERTNIYGFRVARVLEEVDRVAVEGHVWVEMVVLKGK